MTISHQLNCTIIINNSILIMNLNHYYCLVFQWRTTCKNHFS